jgi:hypothetical protein
VDKETELDEKEAELIRQVNAQLNHSAQCDQCFIWKTKLKCITLPHEQHYKKCQSDKSRCSWRGKSLEIVEGKVAITNKQSRGHLVPQVDESMTGDDVELLDLPGKS